MPPGCLSFCISVWDQDPGGTDDFIGYTLPVNIEQFTTEWSQELMLPLHKRRVTKGGVKEDIPIVGKIENQIFFFYP